MKVLASTVCVHRGWRFSSQFGFGETYHPIVLCLKKPSRTRVRYHEQKTKEPAKEPVQASDLMKY